MNRRLLVTICLLLLASAVGAGPANARSAPRVPHPTASEVVVFHTATTPNSWGGEYPDAVEVTAFGDGRIVFGDGEELRVTERGLQRLLRGARDAGLLDDTDFGESGVTDQGTTAVEVTTDDAANQVAVYALELPEGDRGLPKAARRARRELRHFLHSLDAAFWDGTLVTR